MTNLFFIESPLQLLCAIEAKNCFNAPKNKLYVLYHHNKNTREQIKKILKIFPWEDSYVLKKRISSKIQHIESLFILKTLQKKSIENIFIGTFSSLEMLTFLCNIPHKNSYLLDDGVATINVQKAIANNCLYDLLENEPQKKFQTYANKLLKLKPFKYNSLDLFTFFNLSPQPTQQIKRNTFQHLRSLTKDNQPKFSDKIYFLGSKLVESDRMNHDDYIYLLDIIKKYYGDQKIIYIPHRGEAKKNILNISKKLDFEIDYFTYPCEVEFLKRNITPKNISSFFSTALYTLREIYPQTHVNCFYINENLINPSRRSEIKNIYKYYENYFHIISL